MTASFNLRGLNKEGMHQKRNFLNVQDHSNQFENVYGLSDNQFQKSSLSLLKVNEVQSHIQSPSLRNKNSKAKVTEKSMIFDNSTADGTFYLKLNSS